MASGGMGFAVSCSGEPDVEPGVDRGDGAILKVDKLSDDVGLEHNSPRAPRASGALGASGGSSVPGALLRSEQGLLLAYMDRINRFPILSEAEERGLFQRYQEDGDVEAVHKVLNCHLRLVVKIAMGFRRYHAGMFDLIAEGNLGLVKAAKNFSLSKGVRFSTYAMLWVRASVQEFIVRTKSIVRIGTTAAQRRILFGLSQVKRRLGISTNQQCIEEADRVAGMLNVKKRELVEFSGKLSSPDLSFEASISEDGSMTLGDTIADTGPSQEESLIAAQDKEAVTSAVREAVSSLNERESYVINSRKLSEKPKTLAVLSKELSVSIERVRQIESAAIAKMKSYLVKVGAVPVLSE